MRKKPWAGSTRRETLPTDWQTRRLRVLRRDGYRCQWRMSDGGLCGHPASDVDHLERGENHDESNLRALCRWHHARKSSQEGHQAQRPRPRQARDPEPHPGLRPLRE